MTVSKGEGELSLEMATRHVVPLPRVATWPTTFIGAGLEPATYGLTVRFRTIREYRESRPEGS
jgi:hypothetical protein